MQHIQFQSGMDKALRTCNRRIYPAVTRYFGKISLYDPICCYFSWGGEIGHNNQGLDFQKAKTSYEEI